MIRGLCWTCGGSVARPFGRAFHILGCSFYPPLCLIVSRCETIKQRTGLDSVGPSDLFGMWLVGPGFFGGLWVGPLGLFGIWFVGATVCRWVVGWSFGAFWWLVVGVWFVDGGWGAIAGWIRSID